MSEALAAACHVALDRKVRSQLRKWPQRPPGMVSSMKQPGTWSWKGLSGKFEVAAKTMHVMDAGWVEPRDISNAVLFLASDEARFITGVSLPVDAGCLLK